MQNNNSYPSIATRTHPLVRAWFNPEAALLRKYPEIVDMTKEIADKNLMDLDVQTQEIERLKAQMDPQDLADAQEALEPILGTCIQNGCDDVCCC